MKTSIFSLALVSITALPCFLTGCATSSHLYGGNPISPETVATLEVGLPYQVVVSELGEPLLNIDGRRAIAYRWDTYIIVEKRWPTSFIADVVPGYAGPFYTAPEVVRMRYHAFCLKFDENQNLQAWTHIKAESQEQMWEQMNAWAGKRPPQTPAFVVSSRP